MKYLRPLCLFVLLVFVLTACQPPTAVPGAPPNLQVQNAVATTTSNEPTFTILSHNFETPEEYAARQQRRAEFNARVAAGDPEALAELESRFKTQAMLSCPGGPDNGNANNWPTGGAPSMGSYSPNGSTVTCSPAGKLNWSFTGTDDLGISRMYVSLSNSVGTVIAEQTWCAPSTGTTNRTMSGTFNLTGDGTYTIFFRVDDPISSSDYARAEVTFSTTNCAPNSPPVISSNTPNTSTVNCTTPGVLNWSFYAYDPDSNLVRMEASISPATGVGGTPNNTGAFSARYNYTHSGSFTLPANGSYIITFKAWDSAGVVTTKTVNFSTTNCAPNVAPVITAYSPNTSTASCSTSGKLAWSFTATDANNNLTEMSVSISPTTGVVGLPATTTFGATGSKTYNGIVTISLNGTYTLTFTAKDQYGLTATRQQVFSVDNCDPRPKITAWTPASASIACTNGLLGWSVTAQDSNNNLSKLEVVIKQSGNTIYSNSTTFTNTGSKTWSGTTLLPADGTYTITFTATDVTGLTDVKTHTFSTSGCNPKPEFTSVVPGNGAVNCAPTGKLSFSFTAKDNQGDLIKTEVTITDAGGTTVFYDADTFTARATYTHSGSVQLPSDGTFTLWFSATDQMGHVETTSRSVTTTGCDPRPYFISWTPGASFDCNGGPLTWSVTVGDYQSNLTEIKAEISPATGINSWGSGYNAHPYSITFGVTGNNTVTGKWYLPDDGTYTITWTAKDADGYTRVQSQTFTTSRCSPKPVVTAWAPNTASYTCVAGRLQWSVTATDYQGDMNKIVVDIKDGAGNSIPGMPVTRTFTNRGNQTETGSLILPAEGTFTIHLTAYDAAGNVSNPKSTTFTTSECEPKPRITAYAPNGVAFNCAGGTLNWQFTAEDYQGDLVYMGVQITDVYNNTWPAEGKTFSGVTYRVVAGKHQLLGSGTTTIKFIARDAQGNETTLTHTFTAQECTPPVPPPSVQTTAGSMANQAGYANGSGTAAKFFQPQGLTTNPVTGEVYAADEKNHVIRVIDPSSNVTKFAGQANVKGKADGALGSATFDEPNGVHYDPASGALYVADTGNNLIRRIAGGTVSTFAGDGLGGSIINGAALSARFTKPRDVSVFGARVYVADTFNDAVRYIQGGQVYTLATGLGRPWGIANDRAGNVFVAEPMNNRVTKFSPAGAVLGQWGGVAEPYDVVVDYFDNVFVSCGGTNTIVQINQGNGLVTTVSGTGTGGTDGNLAVAQFNGPRGLTITNGTLYTAEVNNHRVRQLSTGSYVWGTYGVVTQPSSWIVT